MPSTYYAFGFLGELVRHSSHRYLTHTDAQQRTYNWERTAGKRCTDDIHPCGLRGMECREEEADELAQERCHQLTAAPTGLGLFTSRRLEEAGERQAGCAVKRTPEREGRADAT